MAKTNSWVKICTKVSISLHIQLQGLCGKGRQYPSIEYFLLRMTERAVAQAAKTQPQIAKTPHTHEHAPRTEAEWQYTYGLMKFLRSRQKHVPYPALKQLIAEICKVSSQKL